MKSDMHDKQTRRQALAEASDWVLRLDAPDVSKEQLDAWHAWMQASPAHAKAFNDINLIWESAPCLSSEDVRRARNPDTATASSQPVRTLSYRRHSHEFDKHRHRRRGLPGKMAVWTGICALIAMTTILAYGGFSRYMQKAAPFSQHYSTAIGEHKQVALPDGSVVDLGAASELTVDFTPNRRRVNLIRGEAYFSVQHDSKQPFEVRAGGALVRDLGTRFDVGYSGNEISVTVEEGQVRMSLLPGASDQSAVALELSAGDQATLVPGKGLSGPRKVDVRHVFAWLDDVMIYRNEPLGHVVDDMNRYSSLPIEVNDVSLRGLPVTGRWNAKDVSAWIHGLARALSLKVRYTPNRILLISQPRQQPNTGKNHTASPGENDSPAGKSG